MLGRGLESLIPPQHQSVEPDDLVVPRPVVGRTPPKLEGPIFQIETSLIEPNPHQPRKVFNETALKELASSISEFGIIQPLVVTKIENMTDRGTEVKYQLIAGERRLLASKMIGLERVPVIVKAMPEEREKLELAVIENLQRADLNSIETARAYAKLQDHFGLTQREIAVRLGKSREVVGNSMRLLNLPTYIQEALSKSQLSESQGRLLLAVDDPTKQQMLFEDIIRNNLSVRELKSRISRMNRGESVAQTVSGTIDPEAQYIQDQLERFFGTKVKLQKQGQSGKILIDFYSPDELQGILNKLMQFESQPAAPVDGGGYPPTEEFHV